MLILSYFLAIVVGLSLGLLGGGGGILAVPVLVYGAGQDPKIAVVMSFVIVGGASLLALWPHLRARHVRFRVALIFAPAAVLGTLGGVRLAAMITGRVQLLIFATIMLLAAFSMFTSPPHQPESSSPQGPWQRALLPLLGLAIGIISGLVGVGGGFLTVPALVVLARLPMRQAVGTSLLIIALQSLAGYVGNIGRIAVPWPFLSGFLLCATTGIWFGSALNKRVPQQALKKAFAFFLVCMGVFLLLKNG